MQIGGIAHRRMHRPNIAIVAFPDLVCCFPCAFPKATREAQSEGPSGTVRSGRCASPRGAELLSATEVLAAGDVPRRPRRLSGRSSGAFQSATIDRRAATGAGSAAVSAVTCRSKLSRVRVTSARSSRKTRTSASAAASFVSVSASSASMIPRHACQPYSPSGGTLFRAGRTRAKFGNELEAAMPRSFGSWIHEHHRGLVIALAVIVLLIVLVRLAW